MQIKILNLDGSVKSEPAPWNGSTDPTEMIAEAVSKSQEEPTYIIILGENLDVGHAVAHVVVHPSIAAPIFQNVIQER